MLKGPTNLKLVSNGLYQQDQLIKGYQDPKNCADLVLNIRLWQNAGFSGRFSNRTVEQKGAGYHFQRGIRPLFVERPTKWRTNVDLIANGINGIYPRNYLPRLDKLGY